MGLVVFAVFFASPAAALATMAGVASIPLVIHFFNRRRYRIVDWAAMRFLQAAVKRHSRRLRLEQWLLLLLRTLMILLPVMAMAAAMGWAEPTWERLFPSAAATPRRLGRTHHVLVIDGTLSMSVRTGDSTAFERAQTEAAKLVRSSSGDAFSVILMTGPPQAVVHGPADDPERVVREIESLTCTHGTTDVHQTLQLAEDLLARNPGKFAHRAVHIFTDLQRSQWAAPTTPTGTWMESWQRLHNRADVAVINVGTGETDNLSVPSLELTDSMVTAGMRSALTATIQNHGRTNRSKVRVELWQAKISSVGRSDQRDEPYPLRIVRQEFIDIQAGAIASLSFPVEFHGAGDYILQVCVEPDQLPADDRRSLPVTVRESIPVLLVNGRPATDPLDTATAWLATALNPSDGGIRSSSYPARPRVVDESRFASADLDLHQFDCVYFCDVARPNPRDRGRLESYLRRGGTVVFTLGPSVDPEAYNRILYNDGQGILPAKLLARRRANNEQFFNVIAAEEAFRKPPLAAFAADDDRAALLSARFKEYWQVEPSANSPCERLLAFAPPASTGDALIYQWPRGMGRVILFTSTVNTDWTGWPVSPSFLPFVQELLRATARPPQRRDFLVGEAINEILPEGVVASDAELSLPDGKTASAALVTGDDATRLHFTSTSQAGLYRAMIGKLPPHVFAVNVPPGESDLSKANVNELPATGIADGPQVVTDAGQVRYRPDPATDQESLPANESTGAIGSTIARILLLVALVLLFAEPIAAWRLGSAREPATALDRPPTTALRQFLEFAFALLAALPLLIVALIGFVVLHAAITGDLLGFLPGTGRAAIERYIGVTAPSMTDESLRWRLDSFPAISSNPTSDRWLVGVIALATLLLSGWIYLRELKHASRMAGWPLAALRFGIVVLMLTVLLPQIRLIFEREGLPDLVVLIDDSRSMGVADDYPDTAIRKLASNLTGNATPTRLQIAQSLLTRDDGGWLSGLVLNHHVRLHVFRMSDRLTRISEIGDQNEIAAAKNAIHSLQATGNASRLGNAIQSVLQEFRGSTLAGVILLTDAITTEGIDLAQAGLDAGRAAIPLSIITLGDAREPFDLALTDLRVDDVVHVGDRLMLEARLTARGSLTHPAIATLSEQQGDKLVELARTEITADPRSGPAKVRLQHTPHEPGEHRYVVQVTPQPGESDVHNNRLERTVLVSEFKRTRVLLIDGRPRYDFRAVKTLLERESEAIRGNKSVELKVLLLDADADYVRQDRTALESFPATRDELLSRFDMIILGDVDPNHPQFGEKRLQWLVDFVVERGGGLLFESGPHSPPAAWRGTPLAKLLPVEPIADLASSVVRSQGYRPRLTTIGRTHPTLRFTPDDAENMDAWSSLQPLFWADIGIKPKPAAEVLAELPSSDNGGAATPLIVQQFVGAGRVMFLAFNETWRWRFRGDEVRFNQFWLQTIRYLAQTRSTRPEIQLDRQIAYRRGEPIRVTVRFPDDKPPPSLGADVKVTVERTAPDGSNDRQTLQLAKVAGSRATYDAVFTRTPEGNYQFTLVNADTSSGRPPRCEAKVVPPPGEMDRLQPNRSDAERAAQASRGRFYQLADASRLLAELPPMPRVTLNQPRPPRPLWNTPLVFLLMIGLVSSEWLMRKRQGLV